MTAHDCNNIELAIGDEVTISPAYIRRFNQEQRASGKKGFLSGVFAEQVFGRVSELVTKEELHFDSKVDMVIVEPFDPGCEDVATKWYYEPSDLSKFVGRE